MVLDFGLQMQQHGDGKERPADAPVSPDPSSMSHELAEVDAILASLPGSPGSPLVSPALGQILPGPSRAELAQRDVAQGGVGG